MEGKKITICLLGNIESIHMLKWARYFSDRGHYVHLISYSNPPKNYDAKNLKLYLIKKQFPIQIWPFNTLLNLPLSFLQVKKLIKEIKPDIINAHYITSYGHLAAFIGFRPLIITAWGSDVLIAPKKSLKSKLVVKYALSKADLVTCDAEHMKEAIIKLGTKDAKIKIINFGIDTRKFSPGKKDKNLTKKLGIFNYKTVISLRSLGPLYNIETLIMAISLVTKEFPRVEFIIAGKGSQEEKLKKLAEDLGITENTKFVGQIPNNELPKYLRVSDIYVSTSLSDGGIASSTAEAMACGLPVIITDVADNKKWVRDGENGFLVPVKNPQILAKKIIYLLRNENTRREFGDKNRRIIEERNDYWKEMEKMEETYYFLIESKKI